MKSTLKLAALLAALTLGCVVANAQQPQSQKPFKAYCEIVTYIDMGFFSSKISIEVNFGQANNFWGTDHQLVDEYGNSITFNSMIDALNYMGERGWELVEEYYEWRNPRSENEYSSAPKQHFILCKTVTDRSEITEGLITAGMLKSR